MSYCIMLSVILFLEELCLKPCGFQKQGDRSISSRTVRYLALPDIFHNISLWKGFWHRWHHKSGSESANPPKQRSLYGADRVVLAALFNSSWLEYNRTAIMSVKAKMYIKDDAHTDISDTLDCFELLGTFGWSTFWRTGWDWSNFLRGQAGLLIIPLWADEIGQTL